MAKAPIHLLKILEVLGLTHLQAVILPTLAIVTLSLYNEAAAYQPDRRTLCQANLSLAQLADNLFRGLSAALSCLLLRGFE